MPSGQYIDVNTKDLTTRYANDVIASCAFGLKLESQSVDSSFYVKAKDAVTFGASRLMKIFFFRCFPLIAEVSYVFKTLHYLFKTSINEHLDVPDPSKSIDHFYIN